MTSEPHNMHRRVVLKSIAVAAASGVSIACQKALQVSPEQRLVEQPLYGKQMQAIAHQCMDIIIPTTDTPGALAAGVGDFVDYVATVWFEPQEQNTFLRGLSDLNGNCSDIHGCNFVTATMPQQVQLLAAMEDQSASSAQGFGQGMFFQQIKELTVVGYFTSEIGATQELSYVPMPGSYDGHHLFNQGDRQWSK